MKRGRLSWFDRLCASRQCRVLEAIDSDAESTRELFDRLNLGRFVGPRTVRGFVQRRRREREARRADGGERAAVKRVTLADIEEGLLTHLSEALDAGRVRGSYLREIRLLLAEIRTRRAGEGDNA